MVKAGIVGFHPTANGLWAKPTTGVLIPLTGFLWGYAPIRLDFIMI